MVKICIISICSMKIFFGKIICSTHQRWCFSTILGIFRKIDFLTKNRQARTLQKWWKFLLSQIVLSKYFLAKNYLFPSSKEVFLHNFRQFLENWIFDEISTPDLTKKVKFCTILNCAKKIFFVKIIFSTHQKNFFLHNFRQFLEHWIFYGKSTCADLIKMVKICTISKCA